MIKEKLPRAEGMAQALLIVELGRVPSEEGLAILKGMGPDSNPVCEKARLFALGLCLDPIGIDAIVAYIERGDTSMFHFLHWDFRSPSRVLEKVVPRLSDSGLVALVRRDDHWRLAQKEIRLEHPNALRIAEELMEEGRPGKEGEENRRAAEHMTRLLLGNIPDEDLVRLARKGHAGSLGVLTRRRSDAAVPLILERLGSPEGLNNIVESNTKLWPSLARALRPHLVDLDEIGRKAANWLDVREILVEPAPFRWAFKSGDYRLTDMALSAAAMKPRPEFLDEILAFASVPRSGRSGYPGTLVKALCAFNDERARNAIRRLLREARGDERNYLLGGLENAGPGEIPILADLLKSKDKEFRARAIGLLANCSAPGSYELARDAILASGQPTGAEGDVVKRAIHDGVMDELREAAETASPGVRSAIAVGIATATATRDSIGALVPRLIEWGGWNVRDLIKRIIPLLQNEALAVEAHDILEERETWPWSYSTDLAKGDAAAVFDLFSDCRKRFTALRWALWSPDGLRDETRALALYRWMAGPGTEAPQPDLIEDLVGILLAEPGPGNQAGPEREAATPYKQILAAAAKGLKSADRRVYEPVRPAIERALESTYPVTLSAAMRLLDSACQGHLKRLRDQNKRLLRLSEHKSTTIAKAAVRLLGRMTATETEESSEVRSQLQQIAELAAPPVAEEAGKRIGMAPKTGPSGWRAPLASRLLDKRILGIEALLASDELGPETLAEGLGVLLRRDQKKMTDELHHFIDVLAKALADDTGFIQTFLQALEKAWTDGGAVVGDNALHLVIHLPFRAEYSSIVSRHRDWMRLPGPLNGDLLGEIASWCMENLESVGPMLREITNGAGPDAERAMAIHLLMRCVPEGGDRLLAGLLRLGDGSHVPEVLGRMGWNWTTHRTWGNTRSLIMVSEAELRLSGEVVVACLTHPREDVRRSLAWFEHLPAGAAVDRALVWCAKAGGRAGLFAAQSLQRRGKLDVGVADLALAGFVRGQTNLTGGGSRMILWYLQSFPDRAGECARICMEENPRSLRHVLEAVRQWETPQPAQGVLEVLTEFSRGSPGAAKTLVEHCPTDSRSKILERLASSEDRLVRLVGAQGLARWKTPVSPELAERIARDPDQKVAAFAGGLRISE